MHIGIDARMMMIPGGHGRYIRQLVKHLQKIDFLNSYTLFVLKKEAKNITLTNPKWKLAPVNIPWYGFKEQLLFPGKIARAKVDLMFFPHWNVPLVFGGPFIVAIHDLTLLHFPSRKASTLGALSYWFKNKMFKRTINHAAHNSRAIITPSDYVKNDISQTLGVSPEKIKRAYEGITTFQNPETPAPSLFENPYLLYVGVAYPHKNLDRLTEAFIAYKKQRNDRTQLVLVGKSNYFYKQLPRHENIVYFGEATDQQLNQLYTHAQAFAYISLSEGFGLPPLEALSHNIPVLASNSTCLPEILGDAAHYVDPKNTEEIIKGIDTILNNPKTKLQLPRTYSWQDMTEQILTVLNNN